MTFYIFTTKFINQFCPKPESIFNQTIFQNDRTVSKYITRYSKCFALIQNISYLILIKIFLIRILSIRQLSGHFQTLKSR